MTQLAEVFDQDPTIIAAYEKARAEFEAFATNNKTDPPPTNPAHAMQIALMRWQRDKFGDQISERMTLGVIEECTESEVAEDLGEALDALGDVMVYAGQLCMNHRLALAPIVELCTSGNFSGILLGYCQGILAQVTLKGVQKIRGLDDERRHGIRLVGSLALCITRCAITAAIRQNPEQAQAGVMTVMTEGSKPIIDGSGMDLVDVYLTVGREVTQRDHGHDAIPKLTVH